MAYINDDEFEDYLEIGFATMLYIVASPLLLLLLPLAGLGWVVSKVLGWWGKG